LVRPRRKWEENSKHSKRESAQFDWFDLIPPNALRFGMGNKLLGCLFYHPEGSYDRRTKSRFLVLREN
jgi:hypothetical protein